MIVLSQTTDKIQVVLSGAVAANQVQCIGCWRDITATPTYTPGRSLAVSSNTTDVDMVQAPPASTQRVIDFLSAVNADTSPVIVHVKFDANGTDYTLWKGPLATQETLEYENGKGWSVRSASGQVKFVGDAGANGQDGSNGALSVSVAEVDFGSRPVFEKTFTILNSSITASSKIIAAQSGAAATDRQSDENECDSILINCNAGSGQFTLNARAIPGPVSGKFKINYQFS